MIYIERERETFPRKELKLLFYFKLLLKINKLVIIIIVTNHLYNNINIYINMGDKWRREGPIPMTMAMW